MKNPLIRFLLATMLTISIVIVITSCATIVGGSKYYAHVEVENDPDAQIYYKGYNWGEGDASIKAPRKEANIFTVTIKKEGCEDQRHSFTSRSFRGWSLVGTIITWTGAINGIPLPWGVVVDAATGAWYKPNVNEDGVSKMDYKNFKYNIEYTGCKNTSEPIFKDPMIAKNKTERLIELKKLLDKGILTQEEFDLEKKKILAEKQAQKEE